MTCLLGGPLGDYISSLGEALAETERHLTDPAISRAGLSENIALALRCIHRVEAK